MPLIDIHQPLSPGTRRWFGLSLAALGWILAAAMARALPALAVALIPLSLSLSLGWLLLYYRWPGLQLGLIRGWQRLTWPITWMLGHLLLSLVYFGVLLPLALWRQRADPLELRRGRGTSAWKDKHQPKQDDEYFRQF